VHYDKELSVTTEANTEQRIAHFVSNVAGTLGATATQDDVIDIADEKALTLPSDSPEKHPHHPGLTERVASIGRSTVGQLALCVFFGAFIAAAIVFVTPADAVLVAKQVLVWLTLSLLALALIYGIVHGVAWMRHRRFEPEPTLIPQTDLAILNWRREKSVFLGTDAPQEDAAASSSYAWPSSSAQRRAAPASRGPGTAWRRDCSTTPSGDWCWRFFCRPCTAPVWSATAPRSGWAIPCSRRF
jgi:hypothetical protein